MTSPAAQTIELLDPLFDGRVSSDRGEDLDVPYAVVLWPISRVAALQGDAKVSHLRNSVQVDVWQRRTEEDRDLVPRVIDLIDGTPLEGGGRLRFRDSQRIPDPDFNLLHDAITIEITRQRGTTG